MILLILFAFIAGFVTILSPCILPILPIVLSGSLSGGKKRPLGVVAGFIGSFTFFTLFLSIIVRSTGIPADFMRNLAVVMVLVFGIFLVIPQAQVFFEKLVTKLSSLQKKPSQSGDGFFGGVIVGSSLGLVWAPCVGPILASIITLSITAQVTFSAVLITLAYALGTAIPMLFITYSGRKIFTKVPWLLKHTTQIQQIFGVLMVFTAIGLFMNIDLRFQKYILEKFPQYGIGLTQFEDTPKIQNQLDILTNTK
jgi:cytochrome c biogenesis protein CcdA